jgi:peptidoglycan/LPS O-acetylase OafA/YrhL
MGLLRILLALSVVVLHCDSWVSRWFFVGDHFSVPLFFEVSGFYMALILSEKYVGPNRLRLFFGNRLLRLLPTFYASIAVFLAGVLALGLARGSWAHVGQLSYWHRFSPGFPDWLTAVLVGLNLTPLGQEWAALMNWDPVANGVTGNHGNGIVGLYQFMLNPPVWSISVELQFYALAPWLVRCRTRTLAGMALLSLALCIGLPWVAPGTGMFWRDRFVGGQLGYFVAGILAYRTRPAWRAWLSPADLARVSGIVWMAVPLGLLGYPWIPHPVRWPLYAVAVALAIPFLFEASRNSRWDRFVGDLSYPVYVAHLLVRASLDGVASRLGLTGPGHEIAYAVSVTGATLGVAVVLLLAVDRPIDRFRQRRVAGSR